MDIETLKDQIKRNDEAADNLIRSVLETPQLPPFDDYQVVISRYIRYRYMLDPTDETEVNLDRLAYESVEAMVNATGGNLSIAGVSGSCNGLGSPKEKRVLTFIVLQKKLGIKMDPAAAAQIETIEDLANLTYQLLQEKQGGE